MSEALNVASHEQHESGHESDHDKHEVKKSPEELRAAEVKAEKLEAQARHEAEAESSDSEKLRQKIKQQEQTPNADQTDSMPVSKELKGTTLKKEIKHIQQKLNKTDRVGSKVIHQPIIRVFSELSAKSITRPSGLLGGGVVAFLGSSIYLYYTKHIGLRYNFTAFFLFLVAGFFIGLFLEVLVRLFHGKRSI